MTQFDMDITIDLSVAGGIFAHDVEAIATIDYEVERYRRGDYIITGWSLTDIRFPNVSGALKSKDWLWPLFQQAVQDKARYVEAAIRNHAEDNDDSDYLYDISRGDFTPAANLLGVS